MNRAECVQLVAYVQSLAPHQQIGDLTALAWHDILADIPFGVARKAVAEVASRQTFIAPADILAMVRRLRAAVHPAAQAKAAELDDTPPADVQAYLDWMHQQQRIVRQLSDQAIADGHYDPRRLAIEGDAA